MIATFLEFEDDDPEDDSPEDEVDEDPEEPDVDCELEVLVAPEASAALLPAPVEYVTVFVDAAIVLSTVALWPYVADHEATDLADGIELSMSSISSVSESKFAIAIPI